MSRILVTGRNGQVGYELRRTLVTLGEIIAVDRHELDLGQPEQIRQQIQTIKPDFIVNAAAYTAVDQAESDAETAMRINAIAPGIIAEEAKRIGAAVIHYSTDYVFDGSKTTPYLEIDTPNPVSVYGKTKLAGERAIQAVDVPHLILRTSWVYGKHGKNFYNTILRLAHQREELGIVDDQIGCPTWSRSIAETTAQLIAQQLTQAGGDYFDECRGIYNLVSNGQVSWHGFAKRFLELDPNREQQTLKRLKAIGTADYPTPATRPAYSVMSTEKLLGTFKLQMPSWELGVQLISESP
ncbi:dTDP-4-dehydrorhamnose reductase [Candidatus Tenderia electrophaga]|mgnify:CR=1 FL=1|uniref:dTDP-4-dehydrorhamnose reductase n=1 Tax=Candidatus Tenderia electrophaga TaxID=1748243 RepID=A0A0S2TAL1_9GAMM|nr:dTDP-4-dehydrorhamnose reductase [Candidatus Tenderia electrophaga]